MAQHSSSGSLFEEDGEEVETRRTKYDLDHLKFEIVWKNVLVISYIHLGAMYGLYLTFTSAKLLTTMQVFILVIVGNLGVTCGAHRLWSHKSYKAKTPLKIILVAAQTLAGQYSVIKWARDHRVHHKYSDTNADPHNSRRGFFFSHVGWAMIKKNVEVRAKLKEFDFTDLTSDPVLKFQYDYFVSLVLLIVLVVPTAVPMYFWGECFVNAWHVNLLRYCICLNSIWLINSAAHIFGDKPYDRFIDPRENFSVIALTLGEGWHNYHHTFPWDYKASEFGDYSTNLSAAVIDFCAKIGWAYDLKTVSKDTIKKRILRTGDGTHQIWGRTGKDMLQEDIQSSMIGKFDETL